MNTDKPKKTRDRSRGGSVYQRHKVGCARRRCKCQWWISYRGLDGRRHAENSGCDTKSKAETFLQRRVINIADGKPVTPAKGKLTIVEATDAVLLDYKNAAQRGGEEVKRRIARLVAYFGVRAPMAAITTLEIRKYVAHRQEVGIVAPSGKRKGERLRDVSPADVNRDLSILRRAFNLAIEDDLLLHAPRVPLLAEHNIRTGFFEAEQLQAVLPHLVESVRPVVEFGYITGWRLREITTLQWRNVDFDGGEIRLDAHTTKSGAPRTFPINMALRRVLDARAAERDRLRKLGRIVPEVFFRTTADDETKPIGSFKKAWRSATRGAGCPGRLFHDLRRTAIRNMVRSGIPERVAMDMAGHATRSVFERYNVTGGSDLKDAALKLDSHLSAYAR
jgi:integrase